MSIYFNFKTIFYSNFGLQNDTWIGLTDLRISESENQAQWINGQIANTSNLQPGQPDGATEDCYAINGTGNQEWFDDYCNKLKYFVCEKVCNDSHIQYENRHFFVYESWNYTEGGDFAMLDNAEINNVFNHYLYLWSSSMWMGLRDINNEDNINKFVWVDGTLADTYTNWGAYIPLSDRDCGLMARIGQDYKWLNLACNIFLASLCEFESASTPVSPTSAPSAITTVLSHYYKQMDIEAEYTGATDIGRI
ncbi:uncharacterized protein TRIADDRAFT_56680 [Trichoplax adhaerens]|uniref:C-type lectin domain-containing protein n=1 Tax=Trichoplax adhaerens TaxID=10228 RepID=B3RWA6_TRIAD|nr:predicted protein [Trichoplax adhaerens]EDV24659.1 predicted protein [Trichoplax adhaerens]|eukprot:XP_002112549.1 predicted protein [Trichoplax adhaerens]